MDVKQVDFDKIAELRRGGMTLKQACEKAGTYHWAYYAAAKAKGMELQRPIASGAKYTTEERRKLQRRILELFKIGCTYKETAIKLNEEGFKAPSGGPVTENLVNGQATRGRNLRRNYQFGNRRKRKKARRLGLVELPKAKAIEPAPWLSVNFNGGMEFVKTILTSREITDAKKVRLLLAYLVD